MSTTAVRIAASAHGPASEPPREASDPDRIRRRHDRRDRGPVVLEPIRLQAPDASPHRADRCDARFSALLAGTVLLTALIPVTAAVGVRLAESTVQRLIVGGAILIVAGLAVAASRGVAGHVTVPVTDRDRDRHPPTGAGL